ncbi:hypothetical protein M9Y10_022315 [Tritrichomonas musculus]|uniref:Inner centromere protein ARK-binding domain-containing protein n=1 Tax=Tritrichomonas musculus TaxID=1915356 RepID=A0ABR2KSX3_9EUKA
MENPEECYRISRQTLELMDQFAGPVNSSKKNLPSILQFPERLGINTIQPKVLKNAPASTNSQIFIHRTEMDENPNMPNYSMEYQYMDFNISQSNDRANQPPPNWSFDDLTREQINEDSEDDDWKMLSHRAFLKNTQFTPQKKQTANEPKIDDNYFVQQDKQKLKELKEKFGFKFNPTVEYLLPQKNPLFDDAV